MSAITEPQRLGRYALYDRIAAGGMATVYFGQLVGSGGFSRIVAVKRLHPHLAEEKEFASMLLDEAYLAGRIRHPNVVSTLDIVSADKELVVVMEYVHGETLGRLMKSAIAAERPIPVDVAVAIVVGVLNGLHAAHETANEHGDPLQIVHRDVSPQNVVVGVDGIPRLLDFGVAKAQYRLQTTQDGQIKGKLAYMAVEQLLNQAIDRRADIYGAGVILWELLTGRRLFAGETESSTMHVILNGTHAPPGSVVPGLPAALDAITMRALARVPSQRFDTARDMSVALEEAVRSATATTVGAWVAALARGPLEDRTRIIHAIEARPSPRADGPQEASGSTDVTFDTSGFTGLRPSGITASATAVTHAGPLSPVARRRVYVGLLGLLVAGLSVALIARRSSNGDAIPVSAAAASAIPSDSSSGAATPATAPPSPPSTQATVSTAPSESQSATVGASRAPSGPGRSPVAPSRAAVAPARTVTQRAPKADCNPPYTVDEIGVRHYKTECSP